MKNIFKFRIFLIMLSFLFIFDSSIFSIHTIILKKNQTIKGTVKSQNTESITYLDENGKTKSIAKISVLKIIYRDVQAEEEEKIRKQEELKLEEENKKLAEKHKEEQRLLAEQKMAKQKLIEPPESSYLTSFHLGSPKSELSIQLATYDTDCTAMAEFTQYYILFGSFPINKPKLNELLTKDVKAIRVSMKTTYVDLAFSVLLGFFSTATRKTMIIESCDIDGLRVYSDKEINLIKENAIQEAESNLELKIKQNKLEIERVNSDLDGIETKKEN